MCTLIHGPWIWLSDLSIFTSPGLVTDSQAETVSTSFREQRMRFHTLNRKIKLWTFFKYRFWYIFSGFCCSTAGLHQTQASLEKVSTVFPMRLRMQTWSLRSHVCLTQVWDKVFALSDSLYSNLIVWLSGTYSIYGKWVFIGLSHSSAHPKDKFWILSDSKARPSPKCPHGFFVRGRKIRFVRVPKRQITRELGSGVR